jgi:5-methyltetrahydropteroyltriglutamate--homocysteine methyltransferase
MKLSTDRFLTTHVGSLPRPDDLFEMMLAKMDGRPVDESIYAARVRTAVEDSVKQQITAGLDVVSDGEMGKPSFITYAAQRLSGLESSRAYGPALFPTRARPRTFPNIISRQWPNR